MTLTLQIVKSDINKVLSGLIFKAPYHSGKDRTEQTERKSNKSVSDFDRYTNFQLIKILQTMLLKSLSHTERKMKK